MIRRIAALPLWAKVALGGIALLVGIALSPLTRLVALLAVFVSIVALIICALAGRSMKTWGKIGLASLVGVLFFTLTTNALFSPATSQRENRAAGPTPPPAARQARSPAIPQEPDTIPVQIRVSGTPGTPYSCKNSSFAFEEGESNPVRYTEDVSGTLGTEPTVYTSQAINKQPWWFDYVAASCRITSGPSLNGSLKAEILADGEVKAEEETRPDPPGKKSMESEHVQPRWAPNCPTWDVDWNCG